MNRFDNQLPVLLLLGCLLSVPAQAAPRDAGKADGGAVQKLQTMVKSLTSERDAAKAESAKLTAEIELLKKENRETSAKVAAAEAAKEQLGGELAAQKSSYSDVRDRFDKDHARLMDEIEKRKEVIQAKNELNNELMSLKNKQQATEQQLNVCGEHNVKLLQSSKDLLDRYQNKGTFSSLLQDEPALQFNSVEMENIIQEYEDKLNAGHYVR